MILWKKSISSHQPGTDIVKGKLNQPHYNRDQVNTQKIFLAVMGVNEALHNAEQEKRSGQPA